MRAGSNHSAVGTVRALAKQVITRFKCGQTEAFYQRALQIELYALGIPCLAEVDVFCLSGSVPVCVGRLDLEVDHSVILELKVAPTITPKHIQQLMKYVRARALTGMCVTDAAVICFTDKDTVEIHCVHIGKASSHFRFPVCDAS